MQLKIERERERAASCLSKRGRSVLSARRGTLTSCAIAPGAVAAQIQHQVLAWASHKFCVYGFWRGLHTSSRGIFVLNTSNHRPGSRHNGRRIRCGTLGSGRRGGRRPAPGVRNAGNQTRARARARCLLSAPASRPSRHRAPLPKKKKAGLCGLHFP